MPQHKSAKYWNKYGILKFIDCKSTEVSQESLRGCCKTPWGWPHGTEQLQVHQPQRCPCHRVKPCSVVQELSQQLDWRLWTTWVLRQVYVVHKYKAALAQWRPVHTWHNIMQSADRWRVIRETYLFFSCLSCSLQVLALQKLMYGKRRE